MNNFDLDEYLYSRTSAGREEYAELEEELAEAREREEARQEALRDEMAIEQE